VGGGRRGRREENKGWKHNTIAIDEQEIGRGFQKHHLLEKGTSGLMVGRERIPYLSLHNREIGGGGRSREDQGPSMREGNGTVSKVP